MRISGNYMQKKQVIVVCGVNHSGTSCIANFLVDHGADPGEYDTEINEKTPYVKYENILFKNCCIELIKIPGLAAPENSIERFKEYMDHVDRRPDTAPMLFKYPKSIFCLTALSNIFGKDRMRVVFVLRNTMDIIKSNVAKTNVSPGVIVDYYNNSYFALLQYDGDIFITSFERIRKGLDKKLLLSHCGL